MTNEHESGVQASVPAPRDEEWLTTAEVAAWLKVPVRTVEDWRARQVGPDGKKVGRSVRYRRSEVERWIDSGDAGKQIPPPSQRVVIPPPRRRAPRRPTS